MDSPFRRAANLFRYLAALTVCGIWSHATAQRAQDADYFFDGLQEESARLLCSDQHFLDTAKLGAEACKKAVELHVEECRTIVEPLETELLVKVYLMCLQSKILLPEAAGN